MTLKLKRTPGLYLVGFMASGKTTIGQALAEEIGWPFVDIDSEIEALEGKKITEIFQERGENGFREVESAVIRGHVLSIEAGRPCVIALGGGAFIQARNWDLIINNGVTVWLDCPLEIVRRRPRGTTQRARLPPIAMGWRSFLKTAALSMPAPTSVFKWIPITFPSSSAAFWNYRYFDSSASRYRHLQSRLVRCRCG